MQDHNDALALLKPPHRIGNNLTFGPSWCVLLTGNSFHEQLPVFSYQYIGVVEGCYGVLW